MNNIQKVLLCSGGRTSGFMLRKMLDLHPNYRDEWITIFCNTGKEMPQTLDFVHEMETRWDVPIVWLEYTRVPASSIPVGVFPTVRRNQNLARAAEKGETAHWFNRVNRNSASQNGEPFNSLLEWMSVLPNVVSRGCSMQLKIRTAMRYLFSQGVHKYAPAIGIRKDEEDRATQILANCDAFEYPEFPLIDLSVRESDIMKFWKDADFDLQLKGYEGNCDLCFLKAKWKRILLIKEHPGMVDWWKRWEAKKSNNEGNGKFFRLGEPYEDLERIALFGDGQSEFCFVGNTKDIPCSCAERGFAPSDEV